MSLARNLDLRAPGHPQPDDHKQAKGGESSHGDALEEFGHDIMPIHLGSMNPDACGSTLREYPAGVRIRDGGARAILVRGALPGSVCGEGKKSGPISGGR